MQFLLPSTAATAARRTNGAELSKSLNLLVPDQTGKKEHHDQGMASPHLPPNPPCSPVEDSSLASSGNKGLNINAPVFVPSLREHSPSPLSTETEENYNPQSPTPTTLSSDQDQQAPSGGGGGGVAAKRVFAVTQANVSASQANAQFIQANNNNNFGPASSQANVLASQANSTFQADQAQQEHAVTSTTGGGSDAFSTQNNLSSITDHLATMHIASTTTATELEVLAPTTTTSNGNGCRTSTCSSTDANSTYKEDAVTAQTPNSPAHHPLDPLRTNSSSPSHIHDHTCSTHTTHTHTERTSLGSNSVPQENDQPPPANGPDTRHHDSTSLSPSSTTPENGTETVAMTTTTTASDATPRSLQQDAHNVIQAAPLPPSLPPSQPPSGRKGANPKLDAQRGVSWASVVCRNSSQATAGSLGGGRSPSSPPPPIPPPPHGQTSCTGVNSVVVGRVRNKVSGHFVMPV